MVTPPLALSVPVPRTVEPSLNVTMPVGVPAPGLVTFTVALSVTGWPKTEEEAEAASAVVVASGETLRLRAADVLARSSMSPP